MYVLYMFHRRMADARAKAQAKRMADKKKENEELAAA